MTRLHITLAAALLLASAASAETFDLCPNTPAAHDRLTVTEEPFGLRLDFYNVPLGPGGVSEPCWNRVLTVAGISFSYSVRTNVNARRQEEFLVTAPAGWVALPESVVIPDGDEPGTILLRQAGF